MVQMINDGLMQLMNQLEDEPKGLQCSKLLCEERAIPPPKTTDTNSIAR